MTNKKYKNSKSNININIISSTKPHYNNYNFVQMKRNDNTKSYSKIIFDSNMDGKNNTIDFSINNNNIILSPKNDYNNYTNKSNNFNPIIYTNTNYYTINRNNYCYRDLNWKNEWIIRLFEQSEQKTEKPSVINLPEILDYYVDFYKIGKTCSGFKQSKAFIKSGGFFSSKKRLDEADKLD